MKVLHLEDSDLDHQLTCRALRQAGLVFEITRVETLENFTHLASTTEVDLILADYRLPGFTAMDAWAALAHLPQRPAFVLLSGTIGEAAAVAAIQQGISDYLHKDELDRLGRVVQRALEMTRTQRAKEQADRELAASEKRLAEFSVHLQSTIEHERAAIAREIHDDIGGSLAAARLDLSWLGRHTTDSECLSHIHAATDMLQHALGASQRIMMSLRPSVLDQGLYAAIQWLAQGFEKRTGIATVFHANNEGISASKAVELAAYRTAQEALTNISKYAACTRVRIELSDAEGVLTLEVNDNGIGFDAQELQNKPRAFGIRGLHERARSVGGWLDVSSRVGAGTSIILSVPLQGSVATHHNEGQA